MTICSCMLFGVILMGLTAFAKLQFEVLLVVYGDAFNDGSRARSCLYITFWWNYIHPEDYTCHHFYDGPCLKICGWKYDLGAASSLLDCLDKTLTDWVCPLFETVFNLTTGGKCPWILSTCLSVSRRVIKNLRLVYIWHALFTKVTSVSILLFTIASTVKN